MKLLLPLFFLLLTFSFSLSGQIPAGYYDQATGKSGEILRAALRDITTAGHVKIPYTSTSFDIWNAYAATDVRPAPNNTIVWDMYSDKPGGTPAYTYTIYTGQCGTASAEGDCYSREHCMPNSWWGGVGLSGTLDPQYTDLHHLFPADQYVNNKKSNNIVGETNSPTYTSSNGSKVGKCSYPGYTILSVFEPINEYKGDFARAYFYLAARYMNQLSTWVTAYPSYDSKYIINSTGGNYKQWYIDMLLSWNNEDPVSVKEIDRNNNIYYNTPQHNRNPFIDHPEFIGKVWGGGTNAVTTLAATSVTTASAVLNGTINPGGMATSGYFEYGNTSSYGSTSSTFQAGSGTASVALNASLSGLSGGVACHFRLVASNVNGKFYGNDQAFTALSIPAVLPEPTSYPVSFSASNIQLQWTDATGINLPDGYLIRMSSAGYSAIAAPADGVPVADGPNDKNAPKGSQNTWFGNLMPNTLYYFKIYGYTGSGSNINYKTDGSIPQVQINTTP